MKKSKLISSWILFWTICMFLPLMGIKIAVHHYGWEFLVMNNMFSGIIAASFFLMGFLLTGVLADYKESERIPDDIATSLWNIYVDLVYFYDNKGIKKCDESMVQLEQLSALFDKWFHGEAKTTEVFAKIIFLNGLFSKFEDQTQTLYIHRLKVELSNLNKILFRVDTVKYTNFISSGYHIAIFITTVICSGLIFSNITPFYEGMFFMGVISFLMIFMISLIHHLDDPFDYTNKFSAENVSLDPIRNVIEDMGRMNKDRNLKA